MRGQGGDRAGQLPLGGGKEELPGACGGFALAVLAVLAVRLRGERIAGAYSGAVQA